MSDNITGSCLCGAVKYSINGPFKSVANCHCKTCKKMTGGVFATTAVVAEKSLQILEGQDSLTAYQKNEQAIKHFCCKCGTPIYNLVHKFPGNCMVQVGSLDDPSLVTPVINIFCESMLPWVAEISGLQSFEKEYRR